MRARTEMKGKKQKQERKHIHQTDYKSALKLKLRVPKGFFNLLEMFTRDLLKKKPSDVFKYGAIYFEAVIWHRTKTGKLLVSLPGMSISRSRSE